MIIDEILFVNIVDKNGDHFLNISIDKTVLIEGSYGGKYPTNEYYMNVSNIPNDIKL